MLESKFAISDPSYYPTPARCSFFRRLGPEDDLIRFLMLMLGLSHVVFSIYGYINDAVDYVMGLEVV